MKHQNKNHRAFFYIVFVFVVIWSLLNIGSYAIFKNYLKKNNDFFKEKIITSLNLDKTKEYILKMNPQVHWGLIFLNLYIENLEFYDKNREDITFIAKNINSNFLLNKIFIKHFIPYGIEARNVNLSLNKNLDIFQANEKSSIDKSDIAEYFKKFLIIKNLNIKKLKFNFFESQILEEFPKELKILDTKKNSENLTHFIKNISFIKKGKRFFKVNIIYANNKNIDDLKINFDSKFNFGEKIIKIKNIETSVNTKNIWRFNEIKKIDINSKANASIFFNKFYNLKKIKLNLDSLSSDVFDFENRKQEINFLKSGENKKKEKILEIEYDHNKKHISSKEFDIQLNKKNIIKTDFNFNFLDKNQKILEQNVNFNSKFQYDDFNIFWPAKFFSDTKKWYKDSVLNGEFDSGKIYLKLFFDNKNDLIDEKSKINSELNIQNLDINCCGSSFPTLKNLSGKLNLNMQNLKANLKTGFVEVENAKDNEKGKIFLNSGTLDIDFKKSMINISGAIKSELRKLINFYDKDFKIKILNEDVLENISGNGIVHFDANVSLDQKENKDENGDTIVSKNINISTKNLNSQIQNDGNHLNLNNGNFFMNVNNLNKKHEHELTINGNAYLNNKSININSKKSLDDDENIITNVNFNIGYKNIKNIIDPILSSVVKIDNEVFVTAEIKNNLKTKDDEFEIELDLKNTSLKADYLKINKPIGENADMTFSLKHTKDDNYYLKNLIINEKNHKILINEINYITAKKDLEAFCIKINDSLIRSVKYLAGDKKNFMQVFAQNIFYHEFDWLAFEGDDKDKENHIEGFVENLILYENLKLKNLNLNIDCDKDSCHTIELKNSKECQKTNHLDAIIKNNVIDIYSDNAGLILRGMNFLQYIVGGDLKLHGYLNQYKNKQFIIENDLVINNFYLTKAPFVAHLLAMASITGAFSDLRGKGIALKKLKSHFVYYDNKIKFGKSIADGSSIGFSFDGNVDIENDIFEIDGSIMPFNLVNILLRKIPVVGEFLVGKPGNGLFSIDFEASGSFAKPQYKINPLKIFIPYAIKRFFKSKNEKKMTDNL